MLQDAPADVPQGRPLRLQVAAGLNGLVPADVRVEFVARRLLPEANLEQPPLASYGHEPPQGIWRTQLRAGTEVQADGAAVFELDTQPQECGQFATEVRIYPWHELLSHPHELGLMKWL
ncbi:MAG: hypothetical protein JOY91_05610 [Sinobacteraceae bacterium]|nr:hypothetical protein [Nevskiaceae bacterium]